MSVDVDKLVAEITRRVVHEVLEALAVPTVVEDEYPDWDEYVAPAAVTVEEPVEEPRLSSLRLLSKGAVDPVVEDEDEELSPGISTGGVVPLSMDSVGERRGGFDPRSNPAWFTKQYEREVMLPSRVAPKGA